MSDIRNLEPKAVFNWFYEINQIPRGSNNEQAISDFLLKFAQDRNLEARQDEALNVIIYKPGTEGYEDAPMVSIQGHMDMVPEKDPDSDHDFLKDPIEMLVDGDWVHANKTTLGADNGIAVAYGMAILDADDIPHPPLEVIITSAEETGMDGAKALKEGDIKGQYLLNIDSDNEGIFTLGCAGGADFFVSFPLEREEYSGQAKAYSLEIGGLKGGHSGQMIHEGRGNAIKIAARLLYDLRKEDQDLRLVELSGGSKHNAIPSIAKFIFVTEAEQANEIIQKSFDKVYTELKAVEPGLKYALKDAEASQVMSKELSDKLIDYLFVVPHGVQSMSPVMEDLVQTSLNVAILTQDDKEVLIQHSLRSAVNSSKEELLDKLFALAKTFGAKADSYGSYPAWEFNPESSLIDRVSKVYKEVLEDDSEIMAIHAGLECGLLSEIAPDTEMVSFGPNMEDIHTPRERLSISSTERIWRFLKALLASFK